MKEGFFGLNIAVRGLYTAQRGMDTVNHNLSNVNTPGYSRQQAVQTAARPMPLFDGTGMIGTGSDVVAVNRIRDEYLDFKYWSENISQGEWDVKQTALSDLEATFNEPSDSGFTVIMNDFYNSIQELAKDPSSEAVRATVREKGVTLAKYFNSTAAHFEKLQADLNNNVKSTVELINSYGTQIQQLNRQIYSSELDGNTANDLRDQRTLLVDKLSRLVNIDAHEVVTGKLPSGGDNKHFVITISGKALVDHYQLSKLDIPQRTGKVNSEDIENLFEVKWADGNTLDVKGGELRGYLDIRDGNDGINNNILYKGVPYYIRRMNEFVQTFALSFNEGFSNIKRNADGSFDQAAPVSKGVGHTDGYELNSGSTDTTPADIRFFTMIGANGRPTDSSTFKGTAVTYSQIREQYKNMTAKNFSVSEDVINDIKLISASDKGGEVGNINILNDLLGDRHDTHMFTEGAPEDYMKSLVTTLGIDSQQAVRLSDNQQSIVSQIENRRLSDSGVSIDEEMTNLVKFQQAYNASAKMITTMAEVYDTLINRMGVR